MYDFFSFLRVQKNDEEDIYGGSTEDEDESYGELMCNCKKIPLPE